MGVLGPLGLSSLELRAHNLYGSSRYEAQRTSQIVSRTLREKAKESEGNIR